MARKQWQARTEITPALLKFREKRKWQIALRRYVLEKNLCPFYAPYFGLDIQNIRKWFEYQFEKKMGWEDFSQKWQFDHVIPVTYFDFTDEKELRMCWNFTNLRVETFQLNKNRGNRIDVLGAKSYFRELYERTQYNPCLRLLEKIAQIELSELISSKQQQSFIVEFRDYLKHIENYSSFEFELLNSGRSIDEVQKEIDFLKKYTS
ncbi:MAG: hypothetical protein ACHQF0_06355 [Chitinophagales bacterium]